LEVLFAFSPKAKAANLVARGGIEPPTRGFSVQWSYFVESLEPTEYAGCTISVKKVS
jgi:hypothetical protein